MIIRVQVSDFRQAFADRDRKDQFSYNALGALFDHFEDLDPDMELDVIAVCCEWSEYSTGQEAAVEYGWEKDEDEDEDDAEEAALAWLQDRTTVLEFDGGIVLQQF